MKFCESGAALAQDIGVSVSKMEKIDRSSLSGFLGNCHGS